MIEQRTTDPDGKAKRWLLIAIATVFIASACIMAIEVTAGRVVSRKMGSSLYTWTSVIGVVLAGISLGNALGGRVADRFRPNRSLPVLFVLCSISCLAIPVLNNSVQNWAAWKMIGLPSRFAVDWLARCLKPRPPSWPRGSNACSSLHARVAVCGVLERTAENLQARNRLRQ